MYNRNTADELLSIHCMLFPRIARQCLTTNRRVGRMQFVDFFKKCSVVFSLETLEIYGKLLSF